MQGGKVHVWWVRTAAVGPADRRALHQLLDADEQARCARLRVDADRHAYVVAHAACRVALGRLLGVAPQALRLTRDAHGKPALQGTGSALHFSLSHTRGLVACAASFAGPLGLDVETLDDTRGDAGLLDLFVCPS